jgi:hypothetical protein
MFGLFGESRAKKDLDKLVAMLDPILTPHGFRFASGDSGVSSGGGFANGHYRHPGLEIGLIYRGANLGCPNYMSANVGAGHHDLMRELGRAEDCALWFDDAVDRWELVARNGLSVADAFAADLANIVLPCFTSELDTLRRALADALEKNRNRFGGRR